jgi:uncharacterized protein (UPF0332 family)
VLNKAKITLQTAKRCLVEGDYDSACNRGYFAMFQAALAALRHFSIPVADEGWTGGSRWEHGMVRGALTEYLGLPETLAENLQDAYALRIIADYEPYHVTEEEVQQVITWAEQFVSRIEEDIQHG